MYLHVRCRGLYVINIIQTITRHGVQFYRLSVRRLNRTDSEMHSTVLPPCE